MIISIALATHNGEKFLRQQLESLAEQLLLPYELVVGDDGSTDGTIDIIEEFAKIAPFPVFLERNAQPLGYGENFLHTASRCAGDWIAFCDQDDVWLPNKLEAFGREIGRNRADIIISGTIFSDEDLQPLSYDPPLWSKLAPAFFYPPNLRNFQGHRMIFRRTVLESMPWVDRPLDRAGKKFPHDTYISMIGVLSKRSVILNDHHTLYRRHASAHTFSERLNIKNTIARARHTAMDIYDYEVHLWTSLAQWLDELSRSRSFENISWMAGAEQKCTYFAYLWETRRRIYETDRPFCQRFKGFLSLIFKGGGIGNFGLKTLIKDVVELMSLRNLGIRKRGGSRPN